MKFTRVVIVAAVLGVLFSGIAFARKAIRDIPEIKVSTSPGPERFAFIVPVAQSSCDAPGGSESRRDANSQIVEKALNAIGRREEMAQIRSTRFRGSDTTTRATGAVTLHVERVTVFPANFYVAFQDSKGAATRVVDTPDASFEASGQAATAIPASQLADLRLAVKLDPIYIAKYRGQFTCGVEGNEPIGKINAVRLKISGAGAEDFWDVDPTSGQLLRTSHTTAANGMAVTDYSDWRSVGGINVAYRRHSKTASETDDVVVDQYEVNPTIDPKLFQSPQHISPATPGKR
jgi:hypothetical protein